MASRAADARAHRVRGERVRVDVGVVRAAVAVLTTADEIGAARAEGIELAIGLARGPAKPEELRRAGAVTIVADLQELL